MFDVQANELWTIDSMQTVNYPQLSNFILIT